MNRGVLAAAAACVLVAGCGGTTSAARTTTSSSPPPIVVTSSPFVPSPSPSPTTLEERCTAIAVDNGAIGEITEGDAGEIDSRIEAVRSALARDEVGLSAAARAAVEAVRGDLAAVLAARRSGEQDQSQLSAIVQKLETDSNALVNTCSSAR